MAVVKPKASSSCMVSHLRAVPCPVFPVGFELEPARENNIFHAMKTFISTNI